MRNAVLAGAMVVSASLFGAILFAVVAMPGALTPDDLLNRDLTSLRDAAVVSIFLWVTALAAGPAITAVLVTSAACLWACGRQAFIPGLAVSFFGAQATTWTLKYVVGRHRPAFIDAVRETSPSFPSGHATVSVALYGFLAFVFAHSAGVRHAGLMAVLFTAALIGLIDFSRLVLSLHFLTDVLAGNLVGAFWLMAGCLVFQHRSGGSRPVADR